MNEYKIYRIRDGKVQNQVTTVNGATAIRALRDFLASSPEYFSIRGPFAKPADRYLVLQHNHEHDPEGRVFAVEPPPPPQPVVTEVGF